jgi:hypothetical protein
MLAASILPGILLKDRSSQFERLIENNFDLGSPKGQSSPRVISTPAKAAAPAPPPIAYLLSEDGATTAPAPTFTTVAASRPR